MAGTRLTVQSKNHGHEVSIRTPGTPERWAEFEEELDYWWNQLNDEMLSSDGTNKHRFRGSTSSCRVYQLLLADVPAYVTASLSLSTLTLCVPIPIPIPRHILFLFQPLSPPLILFLFLSLSPPLFARLSFPSPIRLPLCLPFPFPVRSLARSMLSSYFYWVNMAPLSRGSSATGLAVLVGSALACGLPVRLRYLFWTPCVSERTYLNLLFAVTRMIAAR
jgi:hypothetical protein